MGLFTRYAMDALMKTSHPEVIRRQCWNLHPHRTPCLCGECFPGMGGRKRYTGYPVDLL